MYVYKYIYNINRRSNRCTRWGESEGTKGQNIVQTVPSVFFHRCHCVSVNCVERVRSVLEARVNVCRGESLRRLEFSFSVTYAQKEKPLDLSHY